MLTFIFSKGFVVALIYTLINTEVQREILRSLDRCLLRYNSSWQQPNFLHNYINKLDDERSYSVSHQTRTSIPIQYRQSQANILRQNYRNTFSLSRNDSIDPPIQELTVLNPIENHQ